MSRRQTERMNLVLEDMLRHYVKPSQDDWNDHLDMAEFAVNNSYQESIKMSPFKLVYGKRLRTPTTLYKAKCGKNPAADQLVDTLQMLLAKEQNLSVAQSHQHNQASKRRREVEFSENPEVLLSSRDVNYGGSARHN